MSTGWEIGKEARELAEAARQLHNIANHYNANGEWFTEDAERLDALARVEAALAAFDRCTDADDVAKCRQLLTDDDGLQQGEAAQGGSDA